MQSQAACQGWGPGREEPDVPTAQGRWVGERGGREREGESGQAVCQARTVTSILGQWRPWGLPARRGLVSVSFLSSTRTPNTPHSAGVFQ